MQRAELVNVHLTAAARKLRKIRPNIPSSRKYAIWSGPGEEGLYANVWFRTRGCRYDYQGQCTMCDYGASTRVPADEMVRACSEAIMSLTVMPTTLVISPSGSMFDEWEVPAEARDAIFDLVAHTDCIRFICESRPEVIDADKLERFTSIIPGKQLGIEIGLESADPWILRNCLNKSIDLEAVRQAASLCLSNKISTYANVLLGAPFLTESEAIDDAVRAVRWAETNGFSHSIIFPVHVKPWTVVHRLWSRGLYRPPSLWSLVEVLVRLGPLVNGRPFISWYRPNYSATDTEYGRESVAVPTTCSTCRNSVLALLDEYRRHADYSIVRELDHFDCDCRAAWTRLVTAESTETVAERVAALHQQIMLDVLD